MAGSSEMLCNLVTGGAGFLGSHLCERLIDRGEHVICVDNLSTGSLKNIEHLRSSERFAFVEHDITIPLDMAVDRIYNLACPASPIAYQSDPIATMKTNVMGSMNMLELAVACGATLLQASTSEVYGDPEVTPQSESYWGNVNPIGPRSCYDEGKRAAETLCTDFRHQYGIDIKIVRIFNTYGPRMSPADGRVISNLIVQAMKGLCLTVYGSGRQTRSFCYVDDLIKGIILTMDSSPDFAGPINLGNPEERTILEVVELLKVLFDKNLEVDYCGLPLDDPKMRCPDITLAQTLLGWSPEVSLEEGLRRTINHFAERFS